MDEPLKIIVEATPNNHLVKIVLNRTVTEGAGESYAAPQEGDASPLAKSIFRIRGVRSLFFLNNAITLECEPHAGWDDIVPKVEDVLREFYR